MDFRKRPIQGDRDLRVYLADVSEWLVQGFKGMGEEKARDRVSHAMGLAAPGGARAWVEGKSKYPFPVHVAYIVLNLERNEVRRKANQDDRIGAGRLHERYASPDPGPEEILLRSERRQRLAAALLAEFKDSPTVRPWIARIVEGKLSDEDLMEKTGLSHGQILKARARVTEFVEAWWVEHAPERDSSPPSTPEEVSP